MAKTNKQSSSKTKAELDAEIIAENKAVEKTKAEEMISALKERVVSYHDAVNLFSWYLFPEKSFKDNNFKNPGDMYRFSCSEDARTTYFEMELQSLGYQMLSGDKLNKLHAYSIMNVREHVKN